MNCESITRLNPRGFRAIFPATKDGLKYLREKSALVDSIACRLWAQFAVSAGPGTSQIVFAAVGDFGRQTLFPYSEVDLVFLAATSEAAEKFKDAFQKVSKGMNEIGLKCNTTTRIVPEFIQFDSDHADAILSLLDCRFLEGDQELFTNLRNGLIPEIMVRESQALVERLAELTRNTHRKFANTVFHLEPNVKDGPGGFQDYITARWLAAMSAMEKHGGWPDPDAYFSPANQVAMDSALAFFASVRCFLQFRNKREHDLLTWDAQDDAAAQKVGTQDAAIRRRHRLDAHLLRPRARRRPYFRATARGNARGSISLLPAAGNLANGLFRRGFFRRGRLDFFSEAGEFVRSGPVLFAPSV